VLPKDDPQNGPLVPCLEEGCPTPESYDYKQLTERLVIIKDRFEDEENVILVPDASVKYEVIVFTMDATRENQEDKDEKEKPRLLFPYVVLAGGVN